MYILFFIQLLPVLHLAANLYLHVIRIVGDDEVDEMLHARFEHKLALIHVAHTLHYHLNKWLAVFYTLRHKDSREHIVVVLMRGDDVGCP